MKWMLPIAGLFLAGAAPDLRFEPIAAEDAAAVREYRHIWCSQGSRIAAVLERVTGIAFPPLPIHVFVGEGRPVTAYDGRTIWLNARYPTYYKQATLVHELGHRLSFTLPRQEGVDDHRLLDLFLYDVWTELYGQTYADEMVSIERRIPGSYDYSAAWSWALAMTRSQRQARLAVIRAGAAVPPPRQPVSVTSPRGCAGAA